MTESNTEYGVQASYKFGPYDKYMLNIRGLDVQDFATKLAEVEAGLGAILSIGKGLDDLTGEHFPVRGIPLLEKELGGVVVEQDNSGQSGRQCPHGWMQLKSGNGAKGPWSAYMCPTPKGTPDQCKPVDAKTGKTWG